MTATLTERYIAAVTKSLPAAAQGDVRTELQGSIADAVEARVEQGESIETAERAVITDLGDPTALAAGYADRPLYVIGPTYYLVWRRLLILLLWIVPICAAVGATVANLIIDKPIGELIGQFFAVGVMAIVHVAFWTTLVFFVLERTVSSGKGAVPWDPDQLPEPQDTGASRGDLIGSLVFLGIVTAALLWDRLVGVVLIADDKVDVGVGLGSQSHAIPVLNPELWPWWITGLFVIIAAEAALAIAVYAKRGWRRSFAVFNALLAVVVAAGSLFLLISGQLLNPEFLEFTLGRSDVPADVGRILAILLGVMIVGICFWDAIDGWRKTRLAESGR